MSEALKLTPLPEPKEALALAALLKDRYGSTVPTSQAASMLRAYAALQSAAPAAQQGEVHHWIVPDFGFLFPTEDAAKRYLSNIGSVASPTACYTTPPQAVQPDDHDAAIHLAPDLHIGACITDGMLHATVMHKAGKGPVTIIATARMDVDKLRDCDCIADMQPAAQPIRAGEVTDEREAFEAEMRCEEIWGHRSLKKRKDGAYENWQVALMWDVWQARAILALRPQAELAQPRTFDDRNAQFREANWQIRFDAAVEARRAAQETLYAERERHTAEVKRLQAEIGRLQSLRPSQPSPALVPMTPGEIEDAIGGITPRNAPYVGIFVQGVRAAEAHHAKQGGGA